MKAENETTGNNRTIRLSEIPGDMPDLVITINYVHLPNDGGMVHKAVALDRVVIPHIIELLNAHHEAMRLASHHFSPPID